MRFKLFNSRLPCLYIGPGQAFDIGWLDFAFCNMSMVFTGVDLGHSNYVVKVSGGSVYLGNNLGGLC